MKLIVEEPESGALVRHLADEPALASSRLAIVEVLRAVAVATPAREAQREAARLLASCMLIGVSDDLLDRAAALTSPSVRTLDAVHLASALRVAPDEFVAYDRRLLTVAADRGLAVASPGAEAGS